MDRWKFPLEGSKSSGTCLSEGSNSLVYGSWNTNRGLVRVRVRICKIKGEESIGKRKKDAFMKQFKDQDTGKTAIQKIRIYSERELLMVPSISFMGCRSFAETRIPIRENWNHIHLFDSFYQSPVALHNTTQPYMQLHICNCIIHKRTHQIHYGF